jgi:hypothetical protein
MDPPDGPPDLENHFKDCQYFLDRPDHDYEDVFLDVEKGHDSAVIHAWWIHGKTNGKFYNETRPIALLYTHGNADNLSFFKGDFRGQADA